MCGRYYLHITMERLLERYGIREAGIEFTPREEIFPSEFAPVILPGGASSVSGGADSRAGEPVMDIRLFKWGFSPPYRKGLVINARAETADTRPLFREAFLRRRCLIPVSGFYEWQGRPGKKEKYRIFLEDQPVISLAGLYDSCQKAEGGVESCFTIITTAASSKIRHIHDRMPVILGKNREKLWLEPDNSGREELKELLQPYDGSNLTLEPADPGDRPAQLGFDFD